MDEQKAVWLFKAHCESQAIYAELQAMIAANGQADRMWHSAPNLPYQEPDFRALADRFRAIARPGASRG